jgi:predicted dehydrogenase
MPTDVHIGAIGTGARTRHFLTNLYRLGNRDYLFESGNPEAYERYAATPPEWLEPIRDLEPTVTQLMDPDPDALAEASNICRDAGDDPETFDSLVPFMDGGTYDAVFVGSRNDVHVDAVIPLLERDIDLLIEKPLASTLPDHDRIIDAADSSNSRVYMGFNLRSAPYFQQLKERVARGDVGQVGMLSCHETRCPFPPGYRDTQAKSGGSILEKNCHDFDVFNWLAESDPVRVAAFGGQHVLSENNDTVDHATVIVDYENDVRGTLELCLYAPWGQRTRRYEVRGDEGIIRSPEDGDTDETFQYTSRSVNRTREDVLTGGHYGADFIQTHRFLRFLEGRADAPATLEEAKAASAIAIGAEKAIQSDTIVDIDDDYDVHPR